MKLLHLGDLHLGKTLGDFDLIEDQKFILDEIINIIKDKKIDAVLIAGDVYDKAIPSEAATKLLDEFLINLSRAKVKTFIISGNHDSDNRLNFGSKLFKENNIHITSIFNGTLSPVVLSNGDVNVNIYSLPFIKASKVKNIFPEAKIENYEDAVRTVLENSNIDKNCCNILIAHQFVAGKGEDPKLSGSESSGTINVGTVEKIGYDVFKDFDYVALGHIHCPQRVGRDEVRYSGSPLKYSLSEVNNKKSVPIITIKNKDIEIELCPLKPLRDLRHIKGKLEDLLKKENINNVNDFIYVTLTDEDIINNAMGIFQQTYPNTVKIDYDNSHTKGIKQFDINNIVQNKSFEDLIGDFYSYVYGNEISHEELELMNEIARKVGIIDEAN